MLPGYLIRGRVEYLNSGDWIEHLSALEYYDGAWHLYLHERDAAAAVAPLRVEAAHT